jgi:hypothetical protein
LAALCLLRKLQHRVGRQLVGCIFLTTEQRDLEEIEEGVAGLVEKDVNERAYEGILPRNNGRSPRRIGAPPRSSRYS